MMNLKKLLLTFIVCSITTVIIADSGIYICGHFRRDRTRTVTALKNSGFTFGILFNVHVEADGTLITDGEVICKDGKYVFDKIIPGYTSDIAQVDYVDDVNSLLSGYTSLQRLEHCIGGWGNHAYLNITNLIKAQGTGPTSILYRNFKALKDAIPAVIAINNDIEHDYEATTQSQFHIMLYDIGFKTTIAPYTNKSYWDSFVQKVEAARPGAVDRNYLQIYGGGAYNNPQNWKVGNLPIYGSRDIEANPGLSHQDIVTAMTNWKTSAGIVGGFYWNYNYDRDLQKFASPINQVFGGGEVIDRRRIVAFVYPVKDYKAPQTNFVMGSFTKAEIQSNGFLPGKLASVKLNEGVKMVLFSEDNFKGDSVIISSDVSDISTLPGISAVNSWRILANSSDNISGKSFMIKNKQSGFVIKPSRNGLAATIHQMQPDDTDYSYWTFELAENNLYKIVNKGSQRVLQTHNLASIAHMHDGLAVIQGSYNSTSHQLFIVKDNGDDSYKLIPLHSLRYIGMEDKKQLLEKISPVQRRSTDAPSTDWILVPAEVSNSVSEPLQEMFRVYPRATSGKLTIQSPLNRYTLTVFDLQGRTVLEKQQEGTQLDLSALQTGVYMLALGNGTGHEIVRIIKI